MTGCVNKANPTSTVPPSSVVEFEFDNICIVIPGGSLFSFCIDASAIVVPSNTLYVVSFDVTFPVTILYGTEPSPTGGLSSTPVTEMVCGIFQLIGVNVTLLTDIVPSAVLSLLKEMVTSSVGSDVNTIVNEPVEPSSLVRLSVTFTVAPAISSSLIVKV